MRTSSPVPWPRSHSSSSARCPRACASRCPRGAWRVSTSWSWASSTTAGPSSPSGCGPSRIGDSQAFPPARVAQLLVALSSARANLQAGHSSATSGTPRMGPVNGEVGGSGLRLAATACLHSCPCSPQTTTRSMSTMLTATRKLLLRALRVVVPPLGEQPRPPLPWFRQRRVGKSSASPRRTAKPSGRSSARRRRRKARGSDWTRALF
mmetsp:Transcript_71713/g.232135  ORF Transcript_71713/g.232135 Transcript_71713/m.232135 type:complete len:208 (+) Transcript_71713:495-1118(+)